MAKKRRKRKITKRRKKILFNRAFFILIMFIIILSLFNNRDKDKSIATDYRQEYLESVQSVAKTTAKKYDLFPSVIIAQSALESNWGNSGLTKDYNNYFGIKANNKDKEANLLTSEFVNGKEIRVNQPFKEYDSMKESFKHYGELIGKAPRYERVRNSKDYIEACYAIKDCGYATDPKYSEKLIYIIETYNLDELD